MKDLSITQSVQSVFGVTIGRLLDAADTNLDDVAVKQNREFKKN